MFVFVVGALGGVIGAHHVPSLDDELDIVVLLIAYSLVPAALIWLLYIALEPHVRKRWPRLIISWSRLMAGGFRDPMTTNLSAWYAPATVFSLTMMLGLALYGFIRRSEGNRYSALRGYYETNQLR